MAAPTRREQFAQFTQAFLPWLSLLVVPLIFYNMDTMAEMSSEYAGLHGRVVAIESDRFTKDDGAVLLAIASRLRQDLAVLQSKFYALRIPPPVVEEALKDMKQRVNRLERMLEKALWGERPGGGPP